MFTIKNIFQYLPGMIVNMGNVLSLEAREKLINQLLQIRLRQRALDTSIYHSPEHNSEDSTRLILNSPPPKEDQYSNDLWAASDEKLVTIFRETILLNRPEMHSEDEQLNWKVRKSVTLGILPTELDAKDAPAASIGITEHRLDEKPRRNLLDPAIDKAIQKAGSHDTAAVYLKLKDLALEEEPPFNGSIDQGALCYTDSMGVTCKLKKSDLDRRLKRRIKLKKQP